MSKKSTATKLVKHDFTTLKTPIYPKQAKLFIPDKYGYEIINFDDIVYCEAQGSYTHVHTQDGLKICYSKTLKHVLTKFPSQQFMRIHQSYSVNLKHVSRIVSESGLRLVLTNGQEIPVSRAYRKALDVWLKVQL